MCSQEPLIKSMGIPSMLYEKASCTAYRGSMSTCCVCQEQHFRDLVRMSPHIADHIRRLQRHISCSMEDLLLEPILLWRPVLIWQHPSKALPRFLET